MLGLVVFAGCLEDSLPKATDPTAPQTGPEPLQHVLLGAVEPSAFDPPTFEVASVVASGGGGYRGEPSIWAHTDGTIYVSYPGCTGEIPYCINGPVFQSKDEGQTWKFLNNPDNGSLDGDEHSGNGDADIAVDAAGTIYASDLGGGAQTFRSMNDGKSWKWVGHDPVMGSDRQWITAGAAGHAIVAIRGGSGTSQIEVSTTFNSGANWTPIQYLGDNVPVLGPVAMDPTGTHAFIPFFQPLITSPVLPGLVDWFFVPKYEVWVASSHDGGATWETAFTGVSFTKSLHGLHWAGGLIFPALDVTGDGHVVLVWASENIPDPVGVASIGVNVNLIASGDWGETWSPAVRVNSRNAAVLPWVTGGAGDRAVVTYLASDAHSDSDRALLENWDVTAAVVDGVGSDAPVVKEAIIEEDIHMGGVCTTGTGCAASDRSLLDFFESDLLPDGRVVVVYPANPSDMPEPVENAYTPDIRVAIQNGGTPLLERPAIPPAGT